MTERAGTPEPSDTPGPAARVAVGGLSYALWSYDLGLACCAIETRAATSASYPFAGTGARAVHDPADASVLLVAGTVTEKMAPFVRRAYEAMPEPRRVIAFGACATSGGPYWDSYSVMAGVERVVPVDLVVPGCPPRPEALLDALARLQGGAQGEASAAEATVQPGDETPNALSSTDGSTPETMP